MSEQVVVPIGEYLGSLPFHEKGTNSEPVFADAQMIAGTLIRLSEEQAEVMAFCRHLRMRTELDQWLGIEQIDSTVFDELVEAGLLRIGTDESAMDWLRDCTIVPWGRSLGWDGALNLLAPSDEVYQVAPVYYWLWLYSRTGRPIAEVLEFLRTEAAVSDVSNASESEVSAALMHLLAVDLGRLDLTAAAAEAN